MPKLNKSICPKLLGPIKFWKRNPLIKCSNKSIMDKEFNNFLIDVAASNIDSPVVIINVDEIIKRIERWSEKLKVDPYYFVHCNAHPLIIKIISAFDLPFSCSSVAEIERVLSITTNKWPDKFRSDKCRSDKGRIIVSVPHKTQDLLKTSCKHNVEFVVADSEFELLKIKSMAPKASVLIRIQIPRKKNEKTYLESYLCTKDSKYGVSSRSQIDHMLHIAKESSIEIVGVTFNVGTNCQDPEAFELAVDEAIKLFEIGSENQFDMFLLNIGGGFPGSFNYHTENEYLSRVSRAIEKANKKEKLKIIAEPGRYFVESAVWLMVRIIGKRVIETINGEQICHYHVNESRFGLLTVYTNRDSIPLPFPFYDKQSPRNNFKSMVWGKSGSLDDLIMSNIELPELVIGEYLAFQQCGAYLPHTNLTGLPNDRDSQPIYRYFASERVQKILKDKGIIWSDLIKKMDNYGYDKRHSTDCKFNNNSTLQQFNFNSFE